MTAGLVEVDGGLREIAHSWLSGSDDDDYHRAPDDVGNANIGISNSFGSYSRLWVQRPLKPCHNHGYLAKILPWRDLL